MWCLLSFLVLLVTTGHYWRLQLLMDLCLEATDNKEFDGVQVIRSQEQIKLNVIVIRHSDCGSGLETRKINSPVLIYYWFRFQLLINSQFESVKRAASDLLNQTNC